MRPASRTRTRLDGSALSRLPSALPAEPPPTITKSYRSLIAVRLSVGVARASEGDRLQLGQRLHRIAPADAPDAAGRPGPAAPGEVDLPVVRRLVDVDQAHAHGVGVAQARGHVAGEDCGH